MLRNFVLFGLEITGKGRKQGLQSVFPFVKCKKSDKISLVSNKIIKI